MSQTATILLVEDDRYLLDGTADLLEISDRGYELQVMRAADGLEALELMRYRTPHLIITDIMMPQMNGLEFMVAVRENPNWVQIPIILLTARGDREDILHGRSLGAEQYIVKPFDSEEFLSLVHSQLDRAFQLRQAREQSLSQLKQSILQLLNHEFRTPLTYVTAYYEMLAEGIDQWDSPDALQEYLTGIQAGCRRLGRLVDDLIQVIELRTGEALQKHRENAQTIENVGEHLRRAGRDREADLAKAGITLIDEIPLDLPPVFGVPASLDRVFRQLVDNAYRFTAYRQRPGGRIRLGGTVAEDGVRLTVADNGIGFPPRVRERIFDLFYQHNRQVLEQQGSGTGLTIAKGLIELHGGRIESTSTENAGSAFTIVLPVHQGAPIVAESEEPPRKRATLLLVEDDQYLLQGLRDLLQFYYIGPYSFEIYAATNGVEALNILKSVTPDLIISDVMMPVMDGFTLLEEVRENPDWVQIPCIFLTARREKADVEHGRRIGAEEYIAKPYDTNDLMALVTTQLNRYFEVQDVLSQSFSTFKKGILNLFQPDVRQPLDSVSDYSQQLFSSLHIADTDADLKSSLRGLQKSSQQLAHVVEDFITLAEIRTGEAENAFRYRAVPIRDLGSLFASLADISRLFDVAATVAVETAIEPNLPPVFGDPEALRDSLAQLLRTTVAICAVDSDSLRVQLVGRRVYDEIHLSFVYRPKGQADVAPLRRVMNQIVAEDDDRNLSLPEHGPTLAAVKGIIGLHKGHLEMHNVGEQGCALTVALPIYHPVEQVA
jgi:signal transduction histidine kinase